MREDRMSDSNQSSSASTLSGSVLVLIQFDVCEEMRLDQLQQAVERAHRAAAQHEALGAHLCALSSALPSSARSTRSSSKAASASKAKSSTSTTASLSVIYQLPFAGDWESLVHLASRWVWDVDFASRVEPIVRQQARARRSRARQALRKWLSEDYFIFHVREAAGTPSAAELTREHGLEIAQVVRGDRLTLSDGECAKCCSRRSPTTPDDLAVIGWNAAFLYDSTAGAETAIQLLEYANSQLLEFRHYDELLTEILASVYDRLAQKTGFFARWRLASSATSLHTVLLDVAELTERADNAIKFLSDMFAARLYRLAAAKVGVPDYKDLVAQKLKTAEDLYHDMVEQFNQSRAFFLEAHSGPHPAYRVVLLV